MAKSRAEEIYDSKYCQDTFKEAYELFPKANWDQADEAQDWIVEQVEQHLESEGTPVDEKTHEQLSEMIYAGLT